MRHPDCLAAVNSVLSGAAKARTTITVDTPARATYDVSVVGLPARRPDEGHASISFNDISHIREAEQMRSDFVANVSHELRSPLTTLAGLIETLKGPARDDEAARERFLDLMGREAERMKRLIQDLLSLSRVEANQRVRPTERVDVLQVARRVTAALEAPAEREEKTLRLISEDSLPPIPGSDDELTQVFHNLIENAIKYSAAHSEITVRLALQAHAAGIRGRALVIEVVDQGEGIAPEHLPRLTERFYRVDAGRSRDKGGTGLGLAIVKHIVRRHRGRLHIASEPGKGSTFAILLPVNDGIA